MQYTHITKEKGFTLVEVLVALAIFSLALTGVVTVAAQGGLNIRRAQFRLTANYLASEGVEMMRSLRDNQVLYHSGLNSDIAASHAGWNDFRDAVVSQCTAAVPCDIDAENVAGSGTSTGAATFPWFSNITPCNSGFCQLYYDNTTAYSAGYYNNLGYGTSTPYSRAIVVTSISPDEVQVTVTVHWTEGSSVQSTSTSEDLFNWYN